MILARRKGWIGVDLGTHAVKLAQVERAGAGLRLREAIIIPRRTPWTSVEGHSAAPAASSEEIRAALALGGCFAGRRAACMLPMRLCGLLPMEIRDGGEMERRDEVANELQSLDRGAHARDEFDFWDAEATAEQQRDSVPNVNVLTVPPEWALRVADDTAQAGLRCEVLDGLPLALARATQMAAEEGSDGLTAALDWGFHSTTFCIVSRGRPLFVRNLRDCGLEAVLHCVCHVMEVSLDEAHIILRKHGLSAPHERGAASDELAAAITEVVADPLARMAGELNRTLDYLKTHRPALNPRRILLFGGGATINNVANLLSCKTGLEVESWRLPGTDAGCQTTAECPPEMLGPAIALSSLAWVES